MSDAFDDITRGRTEPGRPRRESESERPDGYEDKTGEEQGWDIKNAWPVDSSPDEESFGDADVPDGYEKIIWTATDPDAIAHERSDGLPSGLKESIPEPDGLVEDDWKANNLDEFDGRNPATEKVDLGLADAGEADDAGYAKFDDVVAEMKDSGERGEVSDAYLKYPEVLGESQSDDITSAPTPTETPGGVDAAITPTEALESAVMGKRSLPADRTAGDIDEFDGPIVGEVNDEGAGAATPDPVVVEPVGDPVGDVIDLWQGDDPVVNALPEPADLDDGLGPVEDSLDEPGL